MSKEEQIQNELTKRNTNGSANKHPEDISGINIKANLEISPNVTKEKEKYERNNKRSKRSGSRMP